MQAQDLKATSKCLNETEAQTSPVSAQHSRPGIPVQMIQLKKGQIAIQPSAMSAPHGIVTVQIPAHLLAQLNNQPLDLRKDSSSFYSNILRSGCAGVAAPNASRMPNLVGMLSSNPLVCFKKLPGSAQGSSGLKNCQVRQRFVLQGCNIAKIPTSAMSSTMNTSTANSKTLQPVLVFGRQIAESSTLNQQADINNNVEEQERDGNKNSHTGHTTHNTNTSSIADDSIFDLLLSSDDGDSVTVNCNETDICEGDESDKSSRSIPMAASGAEDDRSPMDTSDDVIPFLDSKYEG